MDPNTALQTLVGYLTTGVQYMGMLGLLSTGVYVAFHAYRGDATWSGTIFVLVLGFSIAAANKFLAGLVGF